MGTGFKTHQEAEVRIKMPDGAIGYMNPNAVPAPEAVPRRVSLNHRDSRGEGPTAFFAR